MSLDQETFFSFHTAITNNSSAKRKKCFSVFLFGIVLIWKVDTDMKELIVNRYLCGLHTVKYHLLLQMCKNLGLDKFNINNQLIFVVFLRKPLLN